jgi:hypothetical protein
MLAKSMIKGFRLYTLFNLEIGAVFRKKQHQQTFIYGTIRSVLISLIFFLKKRLDSQHAGIVLKKPAEFFSGLQSHKFFISQSPSFLPFSCFLLLQLLYFLRKNLQSR